MIFNKKSQMTGPQIVATILFALIVFTVIYVAIIDPFFISKGPTVMGEQACHFNAMLDNAVEGPVGGAAHPMSLWMCKEKKIQGGIQADNWDKCPETREEFNIGEKTEASEELPSEEEQELTMPTGAAIFEKETVPPEALRDCAQEQIFDYALKCWQMYGSGKWKFAATTWDYDCYRFDILNLGEKEITEKSFTEFMKSKNYCTKYFGNTHICSVLPNSDCGVNDAVIWSHKKDDITKLCKENIPMKTGDLWEMKFRDHDLFGNDKIAFWKA